MRESKKPETRLRKRMATCTCIHSYEHKLLLHSLGARGFAIALARNWEEGKARVNKHAASLIFIKHFPHCVVIAGNITESKQCIAVRNEVIWILFKSANQTCILTQTGLPLQLAWKWGCLIVHQSFTHANLEVKIPKIKKWGKLWFQSSYYITLTQF